MSTLKSNEPENRCPECTGKMRIGSHESGGHDHLNQESHLQYIQICVGALLFVAGLFFGFEEPVKLALFIVAYVFIGGEVIINALKNLGQSFINKKLSFDENFLMSIASIGAFAIGEYPEGIAVMLFYRIGDIFQQLAVRRSRRSITELMDVRPDYTYLKTDDGIETVSPESVPVGSIIVVRPGEKIPLDGVIEKGRSALDVSALTGEFFPRSVDVGDEVLSGSINKTGLLTIKTTRTFGDSTVAKILDLVQNAVDKKSKTENFITRFARYYTPAVVLAAVIIAVFPPLLSANADFFDWLERALIFLVVSCPCALVISIPLSFFGGIGGASRNGILVKGGNCLEALTNVDTVVFDKTGTLTHGECKVAQIVPAEDFSRHELLRIAAIAESNST
ncbi:MAG: HAD-IC family P-type ATPase, partial [Clostridiales bacterium]|nr:HAD-IC family P-type ATPase [Clostridiales bacterium]